MQCLPVRPTTHSSKDNTTKSRLKASVFDGSHETILSQSFMVLLRHSYLTGQTSTFSKSDKSSRFDKVEPYYYDEDLYATEYFPRYTWEEVEVEARMIGYGKEQGSYSFKDLLK